MNKIYQLLVFFCISFLYGQSDVTFIYSYQFQIDSTDIYTVGNDTMALEIKNDTSYFYSTKTLKFNEFLTKLINQKNMNEFDLTNTPKAGLNYTFKTNFTNDSIQIFQDFQDFRFVYFENNSINWKLSQEKSDYQGLETQKATTTFKGRKYIAWFTTEIPISSGPYKFKGLPGLIVEIYDPKKTHHFKLIETKSNIKLPDNYLDGYTKSTRVDFGRFYNEFVKDPMKSMIANGSFILSPESDKKYRDELNERNKKRNNPIELID